MNRTPTWSTWFAYSDAVSQLCSMVPCGCRVTCIKNGVRYWLHYSHQRQTAHMLLRWCALSKMKWQVPCNGWNGFDVIAVGICSHFYNLETRLPVLCSNVSVIHLKLNNIIYNYSILMCVEILWNHRASCSKAVLHYALGMDFPIHTRNTWKILIIPYITTTRFHQALSK